MNIPKKPAAAAAALTAAMFLLQSCATMIRGPNQKIPVTSVPVGARVLVDGKDMGTTPLTLSLKRKTPGYILIEKEGYNPHQILIERDKPFNPALLGNFIVAIPYIVAAQEIKSDHDNEVAHFFSTVILVGGIAMGGIFYLVDSLMSNAIGGAYSLSPTTINIVLTPIKEQPRLEITRIDESCLRSVTWLRIRAATTE